MIDLLDQCAVRRIAIFSRLAGNPQHLHMAREVPMVCTQCRNCFVNPVIPLASVFCEYRMIRSCITLRLGRSTCSALLELCPSSVTTEGLSRASFACEGASQDILTSRLCLPRRFGDGNSILSRTNLRYRKCGGAVVSSTLTVEIRATPEGLHGPGEGGGLGV